MVIYHGYQPPTNQQPRGKPRGNPLRVLYKNAYRHFCIIVGGGVNNTTPCRVLGLKIAGI